MKETFFTSDVHLKHKNILKFCRDTRRGDDVNEMRELIIKQWNEDVKPGDDVYQLGDFSFGDEKYTLDILKRLNGNIHCIRGNHDYWIKKERYAEVKWIKDYHELKIDKQRVVMFHYPIKEWNHMHHGAFHIHGHVHGKPTGLKGRVMDVGIDARNDDTMKLFTWEEVKKFMLKQPILKHGDGE